MNAIIYNKKTPILEVEMEYNHVVRLGKTLNYDLLPIILQNRLDIKSVNAWLDKRKLPETRDGLKEARISFPGFEKYQNMFSLSDQYWVKFNKNETWDNLNYFTNTYGTEVGDIFFAPWEITSQSRPQSPDLTTNGVLKKRWLQNEDKTSYLLKAGSEKYHQEPLSEVLSSMTLERLRTVPFVSYELTTNSMKLCSKCKNFITQDTEFVPAYHIYIREPKGPRETTYSHLLRMCELYHIENAEEFLNQAIAANSIICNPDWHLGNFGWIRNVNTGKIVSPAPLFDFGGAYWGTKNTVKTKQKSVLFKDQEQFAIHKLKKHTDLSFLKDLDYLYSLIDIYPELPDEKKAAIKKGISEKAIELKKMRNKEQELSR